MPSTAWPSSHSRAYRSSGCVLAASSSDVAGPSVASDAYQPRRSPTYTLDTSIAPSVAMKRRSAKASAVGACWDSSRLVMRHSWLVEVPREGGVAERVRDLATPADGPKSPK